LLAPSTFGLVTRLQFAPFQRMASVLPPESPTAQTSLLDSASTPERLLGAVPPRFGLGTTLHFAPSQCIVARTGFRFS
jgi:hypothetical protein